MRALTILIALLLAGCVTVEDRYWVPRPSATEIITAQTRRAQILEELERLGRMQRRMGLVADKALIQSQINRLNFELEQLNLIIQR